MVCNNCGRQFRSVDVNVLQGGCNPAPIERAVSGDRVVMKRGRARSWRRVLLRKGLSCSSVTSPGPASNGGRGRFAFVLAARRAGHRNRRRAGVAVARDAGRRRGRARSVRRQHRDHAEGAVAGSRVRRPRRRRTDGGCRGAPHRGCRRNPDDSQQAQRQCGRTEADWHDRPGRSAPASHRGPVRDEGRVKSWWKIDGRSHERRRGAAWQRGGTTSGRRMATASRSLASPERSSECSRRPGHSTIRPC